MHKGAIFEFIRNPINSWCMMGINKKIFAKVVTVMVCGKSHVTGSVERGRIHFIVLREVEVHLVGRLVEHLGAVVLMTSSKWAWTIRPIRPRRLGGRWTLRIVCWSGPVDHCGVMIISVLVIILRPRRLHEWTLGWPGRARRSRGGRCVIILGVKVKYSETSLVWWGWEIKKNVLIQLNYC